MRSVRIATRASDLAIAQARLVAARIEAALQVGTELVPLKTSGDRLQAISLAKLGGKGLFVKEIEEALLDGRADLAVHSAKDLPAALAPGLELAAFPPRADPRDALVARERGASLEQLPSGARVGTGSVRRAAQVRALRSDLELVPLRGNVPTRLRKLETEGLDAVILACAGLERLDLAGHIDERIDPEALLPAVGQGALAVQGRLGDSLAREVAALGDPATAACVSAERGFLAGLGGDCNTPLAALAEHTASGGLRLRGLVAAQDGSRVVRHEGESRPEEAAALGAACAEAVLADGGAALLAELRAEGEP
jgi:hydroxymethylbilane synthase